MLAINKIHTPCKKCVFAEYTENTQKGCALGLIEKYQDCDNIDIVEVYDMEKEFYVISGKKCYGYKEQDYFDKRNMKDATIEEKVSLIKNKIRMKYIAIIDCLCRTPDQLYEVVMKIKDAEVKPDMILAVILNDGEHPHSEYFKALNRSQIGTKWKIKGNLYKEQDFFTTVHQIINLGAEQCNFVLSVGKDDTNVKEIVDYSNKIVYEDFQVFSVISNESKETLIFNKYVYEAALAAHGDIITDYENYTIL